MECQQGFQRCSNDLLFTDSPHFEQTSPKLRIIGPSTEPVLRRGVFWGVLKIATVEGSGFLGQQHFFPPKQNETSLDLSPTQDAIIITRIIILLASGIPS